MFKNLVDEFGLTVSGNDTRFSISNNVHEFFFLVNPFELSGYYRDKKSGDVVLLESIVDQSLLNGNGEEEDYFSVKAYLTARLEHYHGLFLKDPKLMNMLSQSS
jgi:hypothetical protein